VTAQRLIKLGVSPTCAASGGTLTRGTERNNVIDAMILDEKLLELL
jgi:hypothetical protein